MEWPLRGGGGGRGKGEGRGGRGGGEGDYYTYPDGRPGQSSPAEGAPEGGGGGEGRGTGDRGETNSHTELRTQYHHTSLNTNCPPAVSINIAKLSETNDKRLLYHV